MTDPIRTAARVANRRRAIVDDPAAVVRAVADGADAIDVATFVARAVRSRTTGAARAAGNVAAAIVVAIERGATPDDVDAARAAGAAAIDDPGAYVRPAPFVSAAVENASRFGGVADVRRAVAVVAASIAGRIRGVRSFGPAVTTDAETIVAAADAATRTPSARDVAAAIDAAAARAGTDRRIAPFVVDFDR